MKTALVLLLSFAAVAGAQEKKTAERKRLASVTWDLESHKLVWEVQTGSYVDGRFVPANSGKYEISPDDAVMAFSEERRAFTGEEAAALRRLLDTLSLYCAESVLWWDQGQGLPVDRNGKPDPAQKPRVKPPEPESPNRQRVEEPRTAPPAVRGEMVAAVKPVR
jgi:hypothetical protein